MNQEAELLDQLDRARRRIGQLQSVVRCLRDGRHLTPADAIELATGADDAEKQSEAAARLAAWWRESELYRLREDWHEQAADAASDPDLRTRVDRVLLAAMREAHEWEMGA